MFTEPPFCRILYREQSSFIMYEMIKVDRVILHSDISSGYASIECLYHPELRDMPFAVEQKHGIILAKMQQAKKFGVSTREPIW